MTNALETQGRAMATQEPVNGRVAERYMRSADPRRKSAGLAGFLSLIPGLGQVYVGYYARGFVHAIVVGALLALAAAADDHMDMEAWLPFNIIFLIFFYLYNIIDAVRRATLYNLSLEGLEQITLPDDFQNLGLGGSYVGGGALLVFGIIALSHTAFGFPLDWLDSWWPVAPILFGAWLVYRAYEDSREKPA